MNRRRDLIRIVTFLVMALQACSNPPAAIPPTDINIPQTLTQKPTSTNTILPASTQTRAPRPILTATQPPAWVTDFAEPILDAIKDRAPDFQDDFSIDYKRWYLPSLGLEEDKWAEAVKIEKGVMLLQGGYSTSNYYFLSKPNIVLQIDVLHPISGFVDINLTSPPFENYDRIKLVNNREWGATSNQHDISGRYFADGQETHITIIVKDSRIAYYIEGVPVAYFTNPRILDDKKNQRNFYCPEICYFDNVKFWNLDKVPNLPQ